jgi:hypothetical protein
LPQRKKAASGRIILAAKLHTADRMAALWGSPDADSAWVCELA